MTVDNKIQDRMYIPPIAPTDPITVSSEVDSLLTGKSGTDKDTERMAYQTRSDLAKLSVIQSRIHEIAAQVQDLQKFLSSNISGSSESFPYIRSSMRSLELVFEGMISSLSKEQHACIRDMETKLSQSTAPTMSQSKAHPVQIQIKSDWLPGSLLAFTTRGIEYQIEPPCGSKPGDWLVFDPNTRKLSELNA